MFVSSTFSSSPEVAEFTSGGSPPPSPPPPASTSARNSATWELLLQSVLVPALCVVGLVGNSLSIFVLSRQRMRRSAQLPERAVHVGLVGLAASDMAVCLLTLPRAFVPEYQLMFDADSETLAFYYQVTDRPTTLTFELRPQRLFLFPPKISLETSSCVHWLAFGLTSSPSNERGHGHVTSLNFGK